MTHRERVARLHNAAVATVAIVCVACSAAPAAAPHPVVVVPSPLPASAAAHQEPAPPLPPAACAIAGPKATMTVTVDVGTDERAVAIAGAPVTVHPGEGGMSAVSVEGALAFEGRTEGLAFFPSSPIVVADGVVQLGPMSVLGVTASKGGDLVAKTVDIGPGFQLSELAVPCSQLTFVGSGHGAEEAHRGTRAPSLRSISCTEPCTHYSTPAELDFHAQPGSGAPVRLTGATIVSELDRRGTWVRVATQDYVHMDGAQLTGWVKVAELTRLSGGFGFTGGRSRPTALPAGRSRIRVRAPGFYHGPARIDAGTAVFSAAGDGQRWATVVDGAATFEILFRRGEPWAEILRAPFIPSLSGAWVRVNAVHTTRGRTKP